LHRVAERAEAALGDERVSFIEGCPRQWAALPRPEPPLTIGIDGCYLRQWEDKKAHFEVIVGKSMSEDRPSRCFGFVQTYDEKPKRRLFELLKGQGMQMNQRVMFFSDGGADIREVQHYLNPEAEHYLDWFHITMRLTVMGQYAKGLDTTHEKREETLRSLESVKHYLWHGNVARARDKIEDIDCFLENDGRRKVHIWCCKCALRCSMSAWKRPFVTGIHTSGQNLKTRSSRRLKHPLFYALLDAPEDE
jgi:hypothetical protein